MKLTYWSRVQSLGVFVLFSIEWELKVMPSSLVEKSETLCCHRKESDKKAAASVLDALVPKARQIFQILAEHQLTADGQGAFLPPLGRTHIPSVPSSKSLPAQLAKYQEEQI